MVDFSRTFSVDDGISLGDDNVGVIYGTGDPSLVGETAPIGTLYLQTNGPWWRKIGITDTEWVITFGTEHHWATSTFISTTTSNNFQTKVTLVTDSLIGGTYRIEISYGWFLDSISDDFESRVLQNGGQIGQLHKQEPKDSIGNAQRMYAFRKGFITLSPGVYTYQLQFRTDGSASDAASIFEASIELWRVS